MNSIACLGLGLKHKRDRPPSPATGPQWIYEKYLLAGFATIINRCLDEENPVTLPITVSKSGGINVP